MIDVEIDPDKWGRGEDSDGLLCGYDGRMCALGFLMTQLGYPANKLDSAAISGCRLTKDDFEKLADLGLVIFGSRGLVTGDPVWAGDVASYNDDSDPDIRSDEERIELINECSESYGFRFTLKGQHAQGGNRSS